MAMYIYIYKGPATDMSDITEEQSKAVPDAWNHWIRHMGESLIDVGNPMANGISVVDDGNEGKPAESNGFSIVAADNMAEARSMTEGHPFLSDGKGNFAIDIFELMPVPM